MNTTEKLQYISETMSDGFLFVTFKAFIEQIENELKDPKQRENAQQLMDMVNHYYKLCVYARKQQNA
jgi:hypothetical protein